MGSEVGSYVKTPNVYDDKSVRQNIFGSKYFSPKIDICINRGPMILMTIFTGLFGVLNFVTKRWVQGIVHVAMLVLIFLMMPLGWCLIVTSYVLAAIETGIYNQRVDELKKGNNRLVEKAESTSLSVLEVVDIIFLYIYCLLPH